MSKIIKKLRKLAWIEELVPTIGDMAPMAERAIRRGSIQALQNGIDAAQNLKFKKKKIRKDK